MDKMKQLYEKVAADSALQAKFSQIMNEAEKAGQEETEAKLAAFAKEAGYDVSIDEMQEFFTTMVEKGSGELSDAELDSVAGGKVDGEKVTVSIVSQGTGCVQGSVTYQLFKGDCLEYFQK